MSDIDFREWMRNVDREITTSIGVGVYDFPDHLWHDLYDSGLDAQEAAIEFLEDLEAGVI